MPPIRVLVGPLSVLALASSAAAATVVAPAGPTYDQYSLAVDVGARGAAVASWTVQGTPERVQVAARRAGARRFDRAVTLGEGRSARVALPSAGGAATAAYLSGGRLRVAAQDRSRRWHRQMLPAGLPVGDGLRVSGLETRADGTATLALESRATNSWQVVVLRRSRGGTWVREPALTVTASTAGRSVVDATGVVTAVWGADADGRDLLRSARLEPTRTVWDEAVTILSAAEGAELAEPIPSVGPRGHVVVLAGVQSATGGDVGGSVLWRSPGGRWHTSRPTAATAVAVGGAGQVWVGALTGSAARRGVTVSRLEGDGGWMDGEPARHGQSGASPVIGGPGVGALWDGRPVVWWIVDDGGRSANRWFAAVRRNGVWGTARAIGVTDGAVEVCVGPAAVLALAVQAGRVVATDLPVGE